MITSVHTDAQHNAIEIQNVHWPCTMYGQNINFWWWTIPEFPPACLLWIASAKKKKKWPIKSFQLLIQSCCIETIWYLAYPVLYSDLSKSSKLAGTWRLFLFPPAVNIVLDLSMRPWLSIHRGLSGKYLNMTFSKMNKRILRLGFSSYLNGKSEPYQENHANGWHWYRNVELSPGFNEQIENWQYDQSDRPEELEHQNW